LRTEVKLPVFIFGQTGTGVEEKPGSIASIAGLNQFFAKKVAAARTRDRSQSEHDSHEL
jgi:hypothetical protein